MTFLDSSEISKPTQNLRRDTAYRRSEAAKTHPTKADVIRHQQEPAESAKPLGAAEIGESLYPCVLLLYKTCQKYTKKINKSPELG